MLLLINGIWSYLKMCSIKSVSLLKYVQVTPDSLENIFKRLWGHFLEESILSAISVLVKWYKHSNDQPHGCLLNRLFGRRSKKTPKLRVTGLCAGNSPGPVNSPHKWPVTRKMFSFDDVIMFSRNTLWFGKLLKLGANSSFAVAGGSILSKHTVSKWPRNFFIQHRG